MYSCGSNKFGQLGIGDFSREGSGFHTAMSEVHKLSDVTQVSCGYDHCAAITSSGDAYTWGAGFSLQLGCTQTVQFTPFFVPGLGPGKRKVIQIECGAFYTVALLGKIEMPQ